MAATATIRVSKETRDTLAGLAEAQGISLSRLLSEFASREHIHRLYLSERQAMAKDLADSEASAEYALWDDFESDDLD